MSPEPLTTTHCPGIVDVCRVPVPLKWILCFAVSCAVFLAVPGCKALEPTTGLAQYAHRVWHFGDAGLLGTPQDITQTADGFIWVSTQDGLYRFDGMRFRRWQPVSGESLPSNSTWYLLGARNGSLYVSTDLGLARITHGHVHLYPESPRWPGPFLEDRNGDVWMGVSGSQSASQAICKINENSLDCYGSKENFPCTRGLSNLATPDGSLWIGSAQGVCRWKPGEQPVLERVGGLANQSGSFVQALARTPDGSLWAGVSNRRGVGGLLRWTGHRWKPYPIHGPNGRALSVTCLLALQNGSLWIGTSEAGIFRLADGRIEHLETADGLSSNHVLALYEDHEAGVWAVTPAGVDYFRDYAVLSLSSADHIFSSRAVTVAADREGTVFLGGDTLSVVYKNDLPVRFMDQYQRPVRDVEFLFTDSEDNLWIGTRGHLLLLTQERDIHELDRLSPSDYVAYIAEDRSRNVWVALDDSRTQSTTLLEFRNAKLTATFAVNSLIGKQQINALAADPAGGLWAGGSAHGLYRFHDGRFDRILSAGLNDRVENLMTEESGALWVVTPHGFVRYDDGRSQRLTTASGLPCDSGVNIQNDGAGSTWFYMHCGILEVSDDTLRTWWDHPERKIHGRLFTASDGARPNLSNGSPAHTPDGHLWSASDYLFQVIDEKHIPFNTHPPPVEIDSAIADGRFCRAVKGGVTLPTGTRELEIDYSGLSYRIPELVHFRYRLLGYDARWIDIGGRRRVFYNDLQPGHYVFQVVASNNSGVWCPAPISLSFTIPRAWYQTFAFRLCLLIAVFATIPFAFISRLQRYATAMKVRFDARLEERTRIARDLHDTLLQTIQGSKMVVDAARGQRDNRISAELALEKLSVWLDRASREGRAALDSLRTFPPHATKLNTALKHAVEECCSDIAINVFLSEVGVSRDFHPIAQEDVCHIGYEAIRNACSHSHATSLWITLEYRRSFRLTVRDNGRGIDEGTLRNGRAGHFGLAGMRERARQLGGQLTISSSIDGGTTVCLTVPGQAIYRKSGERLRLLMKRLFQPLSPDDM